MGTTTAMEQSKLSIGNWDLTNLPARLTDEMMMELEKVARSPLPAPEPCDDRHMGQCLRFMLAVLPKRSSDEISGEMFVAAYNRMLGHYPKAAVSYLAEQSMAKCKWMPTIAECIEILDGWKRDDRETRMRNLAGRAVHMERRKRAEEASAVKIDLPQITQADVDAMPPSLIKLGLGCGALVEDADGNIRPAPQTQVVLRPARFEEE